MAYWKANTKFKALGGVYTAVCPVCDNYVWYELVKSRRWWLILFLLIPLKFSVSKPEYRLTYPRCEHSYSISSLAKNKGVEVAKELVELIEEQQSTDPEEFYHDYIEKVKILDELMFGDQEDWVESIAEQLDSIPG